jgi:two-component system, chemotaxis family, CheB/CheR fusion protein
MTAKGSGRNSHRGNKKASSATTVAVSHEPSIVAIGASAGGIEALGELFSNLPGDTGMVFVVIQHLDPKHQSFLSEILSKKSPMPVKEASHGLTVMPNHVYVIPPSSILSIVGRTLQLGPRDDTRDTHMTIDGFMRSLAEQHGNRAIGVILSGSGTDGTLGMAEIQGKGGLTFAQSAASAKYDAMPRSAIAAGCVDHVLSPKEIANELKRLGSHPYFLRTPFSVGQKLLSVDNVTLTAALSNAFQLLHRTLGVDFSQYRQTTILRRIERRMALHKMERIEEYVRYLQSNSAEIKALGDDLLINVTSFFRNPELFDVLKQQVFPDILKNRASDAAIRAWTPGCASGEETYSLAIALLEFLGDKASEVPIQFFGTDVSEASIVKARSGLYPENIQADVSADRLRRFFIKVEGGYRIGTNIRDMCIFAQHNVLSDAPFSQMDIVCCRNLLIYLEPVLQSKTISMFHYALRRSGYLVLGGSEGVGALTNLFLTEDRAHRIFLKKPSVTRQPVSFLLTKPGRGVEYGVASNPSRATDLSWNYIEAQKEFDRRLLSQYAPATVFINQDMEIIHTRGSVNRYLKLSPGRASLSILKMARQGLLVDLRSAINRAKKQRVVVRKRNVQMKTGNDDGNGAKVDTQGSIRAVNFEVVPITVGNLKESYFMIMFQDVAALPKPKPASLRSRQRTDPHALSRIARLEEELGATKEYLQSVIETQKATNEELQSAN